MFVLHHLQVSKFTEALTMVTKSIHSLPLTLLGRHGGLEPVPAPLWLIWTNFNIVLSVTSTTVNPLRGLNPPIQIILTIYLFYNRRPQKFGLIIYSSFQQNICYCSLFSHTHMFLRRQCQTESVVSNTGLQLRAHHQQINAWAIQQLHLCRICWINSPISKFPPRLNLSMVSLVQDKSCPTWSGCSSGVGQKVGGSISGCSRLAKYFWVGY